MDLDSEKRYIYIYINIVIIISIFLLEQYGSIGFAPCYLKSLIISSPRLPDKIDELLITFFENSTIRIFCNARRIKSYLFYHDNSLNLFFYSYSFIFGIILLIYSPVLCLIYLVGSTLLCFGGVFLQFRKIRLGIF